MKLAPLTEQLFSKLWAGGKYAYYWTNPPKKSQWFETDSPPAIPAGQKNVYFGVHPVATIPTTNADGDARPPEAVRSQLAYIAAINTLFAEFDLKDFGSRGAIDQHLARFVAPTVTIFSGGGYHCYWLLSSTFHIDSDQARDRAKAAQAAWVEYVGGDKGAKDLARVLRVPGSRNYKPDYGPDFPTVEIVEAAWDLIYTFGYLEQVSKPKETPSAPKPKQLATGSSGDFDPAIVSQKFNATYSVEEILERNEYEKNGNKMLAPTSTTGQAGVKIFPNGKAYSHHGTDILNDQRPHDAWDCYVILEHNGDRSAAWHAAAAEFGIVAPYSARTNGTATVTAAPPAADDGFLLGFSADDEGNAQAVNLVYTGRFLYCEAFGWLAYNGRFWDVSDAESRLDRAIVETLKRRRIAAIKREKYESIVAAAKTTAANVRNCRALFKSLVTENVSKFDNDPDSLNCANGVVSLRTGDLTPHDPGQRFTYCLTTPYDPTASYSFWEEWLYEVITPEDEQTDERGQKYIDLLDFLKLAFGYSITGRTVEQVLFYLYGDKGRNGKGVLLQTLLFVLGKPLSTGIDFDMFTKDRNGDNQNFDLAPLKPARFIAASESQEVERLNSKVVKSVTGGDPTYCAFKHRNFFEYTPQYKIWLAANNPVNADADDNALWTRLRVINFPNCYDGKEDTTLLDKMKGQHRSGVLRWLIEGAIEWYKLHEAGERLPKLALIDQTTKDHRAKNDMIQMFLDEWKAMAADDPQHYDIDKIPATAYKNWCEENSLKPLGAKRLRPAMERRGYTYKNTKRNGVQLKAWTKE